jgi:hypothetical protein
MFGSRSSIFTSSIVMPGLFRVHSGGRENPPIGRR